MELKTLLNEYISERTKTNTLISEANFKVWCIKEHNIRHLYKHSDWPGVRGELEIYYEDGLLKLASLGERNSQIYATLLTKLYEKQGKREDKDVSMQSPINIIMDVKGRNG